jgi:DNA-binding transcriptional ArsR family regulator
MNQEIKTESEMFAQLKASPLTLLPVTLTMREISARLGDTRYDGIVDATWDDDEATFAIECKRLGTPKEFAGAVLQIQSWSLPDGIFPMLLLPYLKPEQLDELEQLGISGVDLCGNGVISIPGRLKVFRTGQPNRFKSSATIKNVYRGKTSLVARIFAEQSSFPSLQSLREAIIERDLLAASGLTKPIGLSTVSKALKTLEQDLIVARKDDGTIRLLQRNQLLDKLQRNDEPLEAQETIKLKVKTNALWEWVGFYTNALSGLAVLNGLSSTSKYAVMQRAEIYQLYTPDPIALAKRMTGRGGASEVPPNENPAKETDRFENVVLVKTKRPIDYFDVRTDQPLRWASPLQTWLELMRGDKRDRETADQVRELLLKSGDVE